MICSETRRSKQGDIIRQNVWRTSIHLFEVCWSDHLVSFFLLHIVVASIQIYYFHISFSRILIICCKILIIEVITDGKSNKLTIYLKLWWNVTILLTRAIFFILSARKIKSMWEFKKKVSQVTIPLLIRVI